MISLINLFFPRLWSRREVVMKFTQIYITPEKSVQKCQEYPIGSMYGIHAHIWGILMGTILP
jgi:hypothetical protein